MGRAPGTRPPYAVYIVVMEEMDILVEVEYAVMSRAPKAGPDEWIYRSSRPRAAVARGMKKPTGLYGSRDKEGRLRGVGFEGSKRNKLHSQLQRINRAGSVV